jgi:hypothetical protein
MESNHKAKNYSKCTNYRECSQNLVLQKIIKIIREEERNERSTKYSKNNRMVVVSLYLSITFLN